MSKTKNKIPMPKKLKILGTTYEVLTTVELFSTDKNAKSASQHLNEWENKIVIDSLLHKDAEVITYLGNIIQRLDKDEIFSVKELQKLTKGLYLFFYQNPHIVQYYKDYTPLVDLKFGGYTYEVHEGENIHGDIEENFFVFVKDKDTRTNLFMMLICMAEVVKQHFNIKKSTEEMADLCSDLRDCLMENEGLVEYLCSKQPAEPKSSIIQIGHQDFKYQEVEYLIGHDLAEKKYASKNLAGQIAHKFRTIKSEKKLSNRMKIMVLTHEIIHGINKYLEINYDKNKIDKNAYDYEEEITTEIANGLVQVMLSNPKLLEQFYEWSKEDQRRTEEEINEILKYREMKKNKLNEALEKEGKKQDDNKTKNSIRNLH